MTSLRERWRQGDRRVLDGAVVVLLLAQLTTNLATGPVQPGQQATQWWVYLLAVALCVPFAVHRRRPAAGARQSARDDD